jgi:hypothetical protein
MNYRDCDLEMGMVSSFDLPFHFRIFFTPHSKAFCMAGWEVIGTLIDDVVFTAYNQMGFRDHYCGECVRSWKNLTLSECITPPVSFGQTMKNYKKVPSLKLC